MNAYAVFNTESINSVDENKVNELVKSIEENGWAGAPILLYDNILITGSHRKAALELIEEKMWDYDDEMETKMQEVMNNDEIAYDVQDIVDEYMEENELDDIPFDRLGAMFEGTWVEEYKDEIAEW